MGLRRWEWLLPTGETVAASIDESSGVESVWLNSRLVSRSSAAGKAEGHTFTVTGDRAADHRAAYRAADRAGDREAHLRFHGTGACVLVVDGVPAKPTLAPLADAAQAAVDPRRVIRAVLIALGIGAIAIGVREIVPAMKRWVDRETDPKPRGPVFYGEPQVQSPPPSSVDLSTSYASFDASAAAADADAARPAPLAQPSAFPGECLATSLRTTGTQWHLYHVLHMSNRCAAPATCTMTEQSGTVQTVVAAAGADVERVTTSKGPPETFTPAVKCEVGRVSQ